MSIAYEMHRLRFALDTRRDYKAVVEVLTSESPVIIHGASLRVELMLLDGAHGDEETEVIDTSHIESITVAVMAASRTGGALMAKTTAVIGEVTLEDFDAGDPADCHAAVEFDFADTALLDDGDNEAKFWLVIYGPTSGGVAVFGTGTVRLFRPGLPDDAFTDLTGGLGRLHDGQPQFRSDGGWQPLLWQRVDGIESLTIDPTAFAGTYAPGAVGDEWGTNDGQLYHFADAVWRPVEMQIVDGALMVVLGDTTMGSPPNGTLTGSTYRVSSGRHQALHPDTLKWHPLDCAMIDGIYVIRWSESSYAT